MMGAIGPAAIVIINIVLCAVIAFAGGFWILSAWFDRRLAGREMLILAAGLRPFRRTLEALAD